GRQRGGADAEPRDGGERLADGNGLRAGDGGPEGGLGRPAGRGRGGPVVGLALVAPPAALPLQADPAGACEGPDRDRPLGRCPRAPPRSSSWRRRPPSSTSRTTTPTSPRSRPPRSSRSSPTTGARRSSSTCRNPVPPARFPLPFLNVLAGIWLWTWKSWSN